MNKTIVVSAISLRSGGTLSILQDCIQELGNSRYAEFSIYVFCRDRKLLRSAEKKIRIIELDGTSYLKRIFYEFISFKEISKRLQPAIWISLHDLTPNVIAGSQIVYCHNPCPFYKASLREFIFDPIFGVFTYCYKFLYAINIKRNRYIIVQQSWIRDAFVKLFKLSPDKVIVARPNILIPPISNRQTISTEKIFLFPTLPRVFKNIELIGKAVQKLHEKKINNFKVMVTIDGTENRYSRWILKDYGKLKNIEFIGLQPREKIFELYSIVDCLIFPSKLETWGLPISEFKQTGKKILLADLPYADETVGDYDNVDFFNPFSSEALANKMEAQILGNDCPNKSHKLRAIDYPVTNTWSELFDIIIFNS